MSRCTATTIGHITVRGRLTPVNIVLIGMRGVGKTNIARRLSFMSKRPVMSTDVLVEYEQGHTVPDYVAQFGWAAFRDAEFDVVAKLAVMDGLIIDAGGGVVVDLDEAGREVFSTRKVELLKASGTVIFLKGDIGRLAAKVTGDPTRPVLDATRSAVDLMRTRLPFYEAAADVTIDVEGRQRGDIAEEISLRYP
jgi:shikimate kinase